MEKKLKIEEHFELLLLGLELKFSILINLLITFNRKLFIIFFAKVSKGEKLFKALSLRFLHVTIQ